MSGHPDKAPPKEFKLIDIKMISELHMGTSIANPKPKKCRKL
jgi:hypothetical protein